MKRRHTYNVQIQWTGAGEKGTQTYVSYLRDFVVRSGGKPELPGSSDPSFRGDPLRYNPEELLVASLSSCHMLWYLHLCAVNHVTVVGYDDPAIGLMDEDESGSGLFTSVVLKPTVRIMHGSSEEKAMALHHDAHRYCFIARSVNFPVSIEASVQTVASRE
ncbi:MAG TPA: OsmC family protein [Opitutaceae bacterium]|nr:OsmC family protein [Opitutaceae bacterium]